MLNRRCALLVIILSVVGVANADIFRPAYLEIRELGDDRYDVLWKVPAMGDDQRLAAYVTFPATTERLTEPRPFISNGAWVERWQIRHPGGLVGQQISIDGNARNSTDIIARVERLDGSAQVERLPPGQPQFVVQPAAGRGGRRIVATVTAFTVAHSITLLRLARSRHSGLLSAS